VRGIESEFQYCWKARRVVLLRGLRLVRAPTQKFYYSLIAVLAVLIYSMFCG
jgi:hypothetical protein